MRVVENQIFERNQVAVEPETGAAVGKMGPGDPAVSNRAAAQPFIEAGEAILGGGERGRLSVLLKKFNERKSNNFIIVGRYPGRSFALERQFFG